MHRAGFSLVELLIAVTIVSMIAVIGLMALQSSNTSIAVAQAKAEAQANVRDVLLAMTGEIQLAAKQADDSLSPPLQPVEIVNNPAPASPVEVIFQTPLDATGLNWSGRIRFRFINEDANGNSFLDPGEDLDRDGVLSRRIIRIEDRNGDGDTADAGEMVSVADANNLSNVQFLLNNDVLTINATAAKLIGMRRDNPVMVAASARVYLLN